MIGQNGTFFTPLNCMDPYFVITGYTDDDMCGDMLDVHDLRMELHHHLRANGFDAVVFFDRNSMLTMYDMQSSYILQNLKIPTAEQLAKIEDDMTHGLTESSVSETQRNGFSRKRKANNTVPTHTRYALNWGVVTDASAWDRLKGLLQRTNIRTALVLTETQHMRMDTVTIEAAQDQVQHQEVLMLLNRNRFENRNIAVFVVHSLADIANTIGSGSNSWRLFAHDMLLPRVQRNEDAPEEAYRVIELHTPNAGEIRNFLTACRLRRERPLQIEMSQINEISRQLATICALRRRSLSSLSMTIQRFIEQSRPLSLQTLPGLTGEKLYRSVDQRLSTLVGMDSFKKYVEKWQSFSNYATANTDGMPLYSSRLAPAEATEKVKGHGLNVALVGEPGTGKSTVAELIGDIYRELGVLPTGHVVNCSASTLISSAVGQSANRLHTAIQEALGGVLLIDEAYSLMDNSFGNDVINALVYDMGRYAGQLAVVLAGYKEPIMQLLETNDGLFRRVPNIIELESYSWKEMLEIFRRMVAAEEDTVISEALDAEFETFFEGWVRNRGPKWGNAGEAETLLREMRKNCAHRQGQKGSHLVLTREDIPENLQRWLQPRAQKLQDVLDTLDNITGMDNIKDFLRRLARSMAMSRKRVEPGAYVFHGAPGTGKTMMAGKMAELLNQIGVLDRCVPVIYSAKDLLAPPKHGLKPGERPDPNANSLREAVMMAKGSLLFIDEAHQLADSDEGMKLLRDMVPIIESAEFRSTTGIILAGYTTEMSRLFRVDSGLDSRFPMRNRIHFKNYTANEMVDIMKSMAKDMGQMLEDSFIERSRVALSVYLSTPKPNFGNARFIRSTYLPGACAQRDARIVREHFGDLPLNTELTLEMVEQIPARERNMLTGADLPVLGTCNFQLLAGPTDASPLPEHTAAYLLEHLYDKEDIVHFAQDCTRQRVETGFIDDTAGKGINYTIAGPLGSGRKTAITALANVFAEANLIQSREIAYLNKGDLEAGYVGQTAGKTREAITQAQGGTVVICGVSEMLGGGAGPDHVSFGPEAISEVFSCMETFGEDTCFVFMDTESGMESFLKAYPQARSIFARNFALEDLSIDAMQRIMRDKSAHRFVFEPEVDELLDDFIVNLVVDRGGLGSNFTSWNNGAAIEHLTQDLVLNWQQQGGRRLTDEDNYPVREITREMFPDQFRKYLKKSRVVMDTAMAELMNLTGLERVKQRVQEIETTMRLGRRENVTPGLYCFLGNPGVGKTKVAQLMGGVLRATGTLSQGYVITRTARQMCEQVHNFEKILRLARNNVLFIDEAHQLSETVEGNEVVKRLLTALEDLDVVRNTCIILAGYPRNMLQMLRMDNGLSSRLENGMIYFDDYNADELTDIMLHMAANPDRFPQIGARTTLNLEDARSVGFVAGAREIFEGVLATHDPNFGNARYVRNLLHNAVVRQFMRLDAQYGRGAMIPEEEFSILIEDDLPHKESALRHRNKPVPAVVSASELAVREDAPISDESLADHFNRISTTTVLIDVEKSDGHGFGSGFVIRSDGLVLTCAHVVNGATRIRVRFFCPGMPGGDIRWYDCRVLEPVRDDIDMALIEIVGGRNFPTVTLRRQDSSISESEPTMIVGYPFGNGLDTDLDRLRPNHFEGRVSSIQHRGMANEICYVDSAGKGGNSGSPVFSREDGRVIGVFDGSYSKKHGSQGLVEELNHFLPIRMFWESFVKK